MTESNDHPDLEQATPDHHEHAKTPKHIDDELERHVDTHLSVEDAADRWVHSASLLHSNGDIAVADGRIVGVRGRAGDRVNHGRLAGRHWSTGRVHHCGHDREGAGPGQVTGP